jgi:hypothetical protein
MATVPRNIRMAKAHTTCATTPTDYAGAIAHGATEPAWSMRPVRTPEYNILYSHLLNVTIRSRRPE